MTLLFTVNTYFMDFGEFPMIYDFAQSSLAKAFYHRNTRLEIYFSTLNDTFFSILLINAS